MHLFSKTNKFLFAWVPRIVPLRDAYNSPILVFPEPLADASYFFCGACLEAFLWFSQFPMISRFHCSECWGAPFWASQFPRFPTFLCSGRSARRGNNQETRGRSDSSPRWSITSPTLPAISQERIFQDRISPSSLQVNNLQVNKKKSIMPISSPNSIAEILSSITNAILSRRKLWCCQSALQLSRDH